MQTKTSETSSLVLNNQLNNANASASLPLRIKQDCILFGLELSLQSIPLIRSPMGQKNLAVFTGDSINEKMNGHFAAWPKKVAVITRWP